MASFGVIGMRLLENEQAQDFPSSPHSTPPPLQRTTCLWKVSSGSYSNRTFHVECSYWFNLHENTLSNRNFVRTDRFTRSCVTKVLPIKIFGTETGFP